MRTVIIVGGIIFLALILFHFCGCGDNRQPSCGDHVCDVTESCSDCPNDCGKCPTTCGDGICQSNETKANCPADCGKPVACESTADCSDHNECNGRELCEFGHCLSGKELPDGADCGDGATCLGGICHLPLCGNGVCDVGEDCVNCWVDCGLCDQCGNGICDSPETCSTCAADCGVCPSCGDGHLDTGEQCDDGIQNGIDGDGCKLDCSFVCSNPAVDCGTPPLCNKSLCTDGHVCAITPDSSLDGESCGSALICVFGTCRPEVVGLPGTPVDLGTAGGFAILSKSGISTVPTSAVTGNIGVSPAAASYITGFSLSMDSTNVFSTSPQVVGRVYAADYTPPTPSNMTTAVSDMETAFTDAASRAADVTELGAGDISGMTLTSGTYKWGTGLLISTDITLTGSATDVWIFQISGSLTVESAVQVHLAGGALAKNIFWQVYGPVDFGTTSHFEGIILSQTSIILRTGASINGRLLAQTAVTLDSNIVTQPE